MADEAGETLPRVLHERLPRWVSRRLGLGTDVPIGRFFETTGLIEVPLGDTVRLAGAGLLSPDAAVEVPEILGPLPVTAHGLWGLRLPVLLEGTACLAVELPLRVSHATPWQLHSAPSSSRYTAPEP